MTPSSQAVVPTTSSPYVIHPATIPTRLRESEGIDTFRFIEPDIRRADRFSSVQFMVSLFDVGAAAIWIVTDPDEPDHLDRMIRA